MKNILLILFLGTTVTLFGQKKETTIDYLITEDNWRKEAFPFPVPFAPQIDYEGYEEAQFAKGWSKAESPEFWTYSFLWHIDTKNELTEKELEINLQYYFDGLMKIINRDTNFTVPPSVALFLKKDNKNGLSTYHGKANFYDAFFTKGLFQLNILVEQSYCSEKDRLNVLFKFSPKDFNDAMWETLRKIRINPEVCK